MRIPTFGQFNRCNSELEAERDVNETKASQKAVPWIRVIGWTSVATGAIAVGYFVGRNLRTRYKLNHRTPYDFYSHAGDNGNGVEYGVGV